MTNALHPDRMTAAERLDEVADILARGILRAEAEDPAPPPPDASMGLPLGLHVIDHPAMWSSLNGYSTADIRAIFNRSPAQEIPDGRAAIIWTVATLSTLIAPYARDSPRS